MDNTEFAARTERLKGRLYRVALLYLGSESPAADAVDEAVYRGLLSLKKLRQPEFFETWMTRILINECKKALKRRHRESPAEELPETAAPDYDALPLKDAIGKLPRELREVVALRYFADLSLSDTSRCLGVPQGTVVTRQRRALSLLKLELTEEGT